jgi:DNA-binding Lrp family transcriptional regulator
MNLRYMSMSQLAEATGVDRRTVKSRLAELEHVKKDGKAIIYDAHRALPLVLGMAGSSESQTDKLLKEASLRRESAAADKLEIENAKTRGELVAIEDVTRTVAKEYTYVRASILSMPSKLAKPIAMEDDPSVCMSMMKKEVDEILNHLQADVNLQIEPEEVDEKYFTDEETAQ